MLGNANIFFGSTESEKGELSDLFCPYDNRLASRQIKCSADDAKKALETAKSAKAAAKAAPLHRRISWMQDVAERLSERAEEFANYITMETAKPFGMAHSEVMRGVDTLRLSATAASQVTGRTIPTDASPNGAKTTAFYIREPVGVIVAITPFNFPVNLVLHKLAPALVSGNCVVLKPSPEAPYTAYALAKLFIESKFATPDALSVVYGDAEVGEALVSSDIPRVISFTGSAAVGLRITQKAGIKKISLELGGNAALFIEKSSDIKKAAARCAIGAFANSGQVCISLQRIYVDNAVIEEFNGFFSEECKKLKVGDPFSPDTFIGPMINEDAAKRAKAWIDEAVGMGAKIVTGGSLTGCILEPTVLSNVTPAMKVICEEVFAPIVSVIGVNGFDEAVKLINDSPYGLQFAIFTNDLKLAQRAIEEFECGGVVINDIPTLRFDNQPYGGVKLSGIGREGPLYAIEEFTEIKSVVIAQ